MAKRKNSNPVQNLLDTVGEFVNKQKGKWEHKDWEALVDKVQKGGVVLTDEYKKSLGHMLEATKQFYGSLSVPDKKKAAPKPKARAKAKPKAKAKAKAKS
ncbi:MAG: hypothetical protein IT366_04040 [Candidatus Hydrogenedentes bacterium]|nr:hypothetical protein [Candidatus Hydrogenedentota bacterium]